MGQPIWVHTNLRHCFPDMINRCSNSRYVMLIFSDCCYWFLGDTENMPAIEVGRLCIKQLGRENGKKCVIIDVMDKSFVLVTGPKKVTGVKRRRVNINHVMPLQDKIEVKRGASDEEVSQALETAGKLKDMTA
jgi:large subunit ribosomal protein L14e